MKHLLTAGLLLLSLAACKDRDADPNVLPPATQTGANTAGCLVDGKVWVATKKNTSSGLYVSETSVEKYPDGSYQMKLELENVTNKHSKILIRAHIHNFELNKYYDLPINNDNDYNLSMYTDNGSKSYFSKNPDFMGKIKFTKVDIPNNIVSGVFEFDAVDKDGHLIHITDGRFDKKFD